MADYAIDLYIDGGTVHGGLRVSGFSTRTTAGEVGLVLADALRNHFGADTHFAFVGSPVAHDPHVYRAEVERVTRRLWHTSQHQGCLIWLSGRIQDDVNALRAAVGLAEFGWNDSVPDEEVGRCAVHHDDYCAGQHAHNPPIRGI